MILNPDLLSSQLLNSTDLEMSLFRVTFLFKHFQTFPVAFASWHAEGHGIILLLPAFLCRFALNEELQRRSGRLVLRSQDLELVKQIRARRSDVKVVGSILLTTDQLPHLAELRWSRFPIQYDVH